MGRKVSFVLYGLVFLMGCSHFTGQDCYALASPKGNSTNIGTAPSERNDSMTAMPKENMPQPATSSNSTSPGPATADFSDFNRTFLSTNGSTAMVPTQSPEKQLNFITSTMNNATVLTGSTQQPVNWSYSTSMPHASILASTVSEATITHSLQRSSLSPQSKAIQNTPSQLNVGDKDQDKSGHLLAGLVSVFILAAGMISLLLFLKFRQRINSPEFRRLQDLPMDDMMEDTPLSMHSY
ncbi:mucin-5AC-like [Arapaima gigas]